MASFTSAFSADTSFMYTAQSDSQATMTGKSTKHVPGFTHVPALMSYQAAFIRQGVCRMPKHTKLYRLKVICCACWQSCFFAAERKASVLFSLVHVRSVAAVLQTIRKLMLLLCVTDCRCAYQYCCYRPADYNSSSVIACAARSVAAVYTTQ